MRITDLHCDTVLEMMNGANIVTGNPNGHVDLPRMKEANMACQVFAAWVSTNIPEERSFQVCEDFIKRILSLVEEHHDHFDLIVTAQDLKNSKNTSKPGIMVAVENGKALQGNIANIQKLREKHVRYLTITHNDHLDWALSATGGSAPFEGLTKFGENVIAGLNDNGIIPDLSHVHESSFWQIVKLSKKPLIASHSNAKALHDHPRNLTDDQIKAIADSGGLVAVNLYPVFLSAQYANFAKNEWGELTKKLKESRFSADELPKAEVAETLDFFAKVRRKEWEKGAFMPLEKYLDHIFHIIDLVGDEFVAFGSDFDGVATLPEGITGCDGYNLILEKLAERGLSAESRQKISFGNFLRVLELTD